MMQYKVIRKAQPGVAGGGSHKYYAAAHYSGEIDFDSLSKEMSKRSTIHRADAAAVLVMLEELIIEGLKAGKVVRLGELGSFRIVLSSNGSGQREEVGPQSIKKGRMYFRPAKRVTDELDMLRYKEVKE